MINIISCR